MLRQIAHLTHSVEGIDGACAVAVYANALNVDLVAQETGFEGVACVDDSARALELLSLLYANTGLEWIRTWAMGLLEFVLAMEDGSGGWVNFIKDWSGTQNRTGITSAPGVNFWSARAWHSLEVAERTFNDPRIRASCARALERAAEESLESDALSIQLDAVISSSRSSHIMSDLANRWADEIVSCQYEGILLNFKGEVPIPHLWGHIQEAVLVRAASRLGRPSLAEAARVSADRWFGKVIESEFDLPSVQSYGVASLIEGCDALAIAFPEGPYRKWAQTARQWFDGRNNAHMPVYDRELGRVGDGIDNGVVNRSSGAESNIMAGFALLDDLIQRVPSFTPLLQEMASTYRLE